MDKEKAQTQSALLLQKNEENLYKNASFRYTNMRYVALILACCLMVGSYYCFDNPSALAKYLQDQQGELKLTSIQFNLLYSVYSFPNIILPFIGGFILDKIGVRIGIFLFSFILIIGQSIFALGGYYQNYTVLLLGRIVFGLGGECLVWFKNDNLAMAMGLNISFSRYFFKSDWALPSTPT